MNSIKKNTSLTQALDIQPGDVLAFVGAGGKTSLMLALAEELYNSGLKVGITTTTKIGTNELPANQPNELVVETDPEKLLSKVRSIIDQHKIPVLVSGVDPKNERLLGIDNHTADIITIKKAVEVLLIEADGARRKPFKIPMPHEPVVPGCVNKLCIAIGLDAIGLEITEENFYNTTGMQELGAILGEKLTPLILRGLLLHQTGFLRFKDSVRKIYLILNKADKIRDDIMLFELVTELFHNDLEKIIVTSTKQEPIVRQIPDNSYHHITGIILAAGMGSRFNGVKQLADINGRTLAHHITKQALESDLDDVVLVLGHKYYEVKESLEKLIKDNKLSIVRNKNYTDGMGSSLIIGLESVLGISDDVMIILGDQPNITTEILNKLIHEYRRSNARLCVPIIKTGEGLRPGNPVILNQQLFPDLLLIHGDIGARQVVSKNFELAKLVEFQDEDSQFQINTIEDLKTYIAKK